MNLYLSDIAPIGNEELQQYQQQLQKERQQQLQQNEKTQKKKLKAEKNLSKAQKKVEKAQLKGEKAKKQVEKAQQKSQKAQKQIEKAQKDVEKAQKELQKFNLQAANGTTNTPASTVASVQVPQGPAVEHAAMPTGIVLSICASLLLSLGSAWLYRRSSSRIKG